MGVGGTTLDARFVRDVSATGRMTRRPPPRMVKRRAAPKTRQVKKRKGGARRKTVRKGQRGGGFNPSNLLPLAPLLLM